jgi:hypothetical protein
MRNPFVVALQSVRDHCKIAVLSLCNRCAKTAQKLSNLCAIALQSVRNQCAISVLSLCVRCAIS